MNSIAHDFLAIWYGKIERPNNVKKRIAPRRGKKDRGVMFD